MKKRILKIFCYGALVVQYFCRHQFYIMMNLEKLNILTYLLLVAFLPVLILGITSFIYGFLSDLKKYRKYGAVITMAVIYSVIGWCLISILWILLWWTISLKIRSIIGKCQYDGTVWYYRRYVSGVLVKCCIFLYWMLFR